MSAHAKHWDELTEDSKRVLYYRGDPRVPTDYSPLQNKTWENMNNNQKITAWKKGLSVVPEGWSPDGDFKSMLRLKVSLEKQLAQTNDKLKEML